MLLRLSVSLSGSLSLKFRGSCRHARRGCGTGVEIFDEMHEHTTGEILLHLLRFADICFRVSVRSVALLYLGIGLSGEHVFEAKMFGRASISPPQRRELRGSISEAQKQDRMSLPTAITCARVDELA